MKVLSVILAFSIFTSSVTCNNIPDDSELVENIIVLIERVEELEEYSGQLEQLIAEYGHLAQQDSIIIAEYENQVDLLHEEIEVYNQAIASIKPKWHENKILWYIYGIATMVGGAWVAGQVSK